MKTVDSYSGYTNIQNFVFMYFTNINQEYKYLLKYIYKHAHIFTWGFRLNIGQNYIELWSKFHLNAMDQILTIY